ncbi:MAG: hypothetical protein LBT17_01540, partial [Mycoplasmataceae bacterium]|nr:hypothetical protein [Mycoplasmataceae bacterium]
SIFYDYYGSVFRHFILAVISYMILFNTPKYEFKTSKTEHRNFLKTDLWFSIVVWSIYLIYILIMSNIMRSMLDTGGDTDRFYYNCSGLYRQDYWKEGPYYQFSALGAVWPLPSILLWLLVFGFVTGINFVWNCIKKRPKYNYKHPDHFYLPSPKNGSPCKWWHW